MIPASIPSPSVGVLWLGPVPLRAYGLLIVTAIAVAAWITWDRYKKRGGDGDVALDAVLWAVPFGLVGARFYHVITHLSDYFAPGIDPWSVFKVWEGGMAIFGGIAFGALGAVIGIRRAGQRLGPFADSVAPALLIAQAIGRLGNYFNQELFGGPTDLPWGLEIKDPILESFGLSAGTLVHPIFLYEIIWNLCMAGLLLFIDKKVKVKSGQLMALYLVAYGTGRIIMETMRLDTPGRILGLRINMFTAICVVVLGLLVFYICGRVGASTTVSPEEVAQYKAKVAKREGKAGDLTDAESVSGDSSDDSAGETGSSVSAQLDSAESES
ncbi:MAG: prolipoprotein diacylglyceryl transferase [Scrofimicrobium sp.]